MKGRQCLVSLFPSLVLSASPEPPRLASNICKDVTFSVTATATNRVAANPPTDFSNLTQVVAFLTQPVVNQANPITGTYNIYGQHCVPAGSNHKAALQLLVHGNTYYHTYFSAFQNSPTNNPNGYANYALSQGYPTLAIDRLGTGASDHPDPVNVVQAPLQAELLHVLIVQLRGPTRPQWPFTSQSKIVFVGHSYGSILGTQLSTKHPQDIDAFVQTGLAIPLPNENALPGQLADVYVQASTYNPQRFAPATYAHGYLASSNKQGREETYYSQPGDYSEALYNLDFANERTVALGEVLTQNLYNSTTYSNPVFVYTGQEDAIFCGNGTRAIGPPDCGPGGSQVAAVKALYPAVPASKFGFYAQPRAGHASQLHYTAQHGFARAHAFLQQQGL